MINKFAQSFFLSCFALFAAAQSQRTILFENFVQASCYYSSVYNPEIKNYLDTSILPIVVINYHLSFPGEDPMYDDNSSDVEARMDFYEIYKSPLSVIDGNHFLGGPIGSYLNGTYGWNANTMNNRANEESPFEIVVNHEFFENTDQVEIQLTIKATETISGDFTLNVVVLEKQISYNEPPGTNGETLFYHVMKDFISDSEFELENSFIKGDSVFFTSIWQIENVYEKEMIALAAFIQDNSTREVLQAGLSRAKAINNTDIELMSVIEPTSNYCFDPVYNTVFPAIKIRNRGSRKLDSLIVYSRVNNEPEDTNHYSLDLSFFQTTELELNQLSFSGSLTDTLEIKLEIPDGDIETDTTNNYITFIFDTIPDIISSELFLEIKPDNYGSEITWEFTNNSGTVLFSGGPYFDFNTSVILDTILMTKKGCYNFAIYDSYGDGINSEYGEGYYKIKNQEGETLFQGGDFKNYETVDIKNYKISPSPGFIPSDGSVNVGIDAQVGINFYEYVRFLNNSTLGDPDSMFVFKKNNEFGEDVVVNFGNYDNYYVYFNDDLEYGTIYYLAFKDGLEDYYDNPIPGESITFTTVSGKNATNSGDPKTDFTISPNPTKDFINIKSKEFAIDRIDIINQFGQLIGTHKNLVQIIDISHYQPGIYFLRIQANNQIYTRKIVKID